MKNLKKLKSQSKIFINMKKLFLFIVLGLMLTSCVVTNRPRPTYKRYWYKPWHGPKRYITYPPRHCRF